MRERECVVSVCYTAIPAIHASSRMAQKLGEPPRRGKIWGKGKGKSAHLDSQKINKNWPKEGNNQEKKKKKNCQESGIFFHFPPPDR